MLWKKQPGVEQPVSGFDKNYIIYQLHQTFILKILLVSCNKMLILFTDKQNGTKHKYYSQRERFGTL